MVKASYKEKYKLHQKTTEQERTEKVRMVLSKSKQLSSIEVNDGSNNIILLNNVIDINSTINCITYGLYKNTKAQTNLLYDVLPISENTYALKL